MASYNVGCSAGTDGGADRDFVLGGGAVCASAIVNVRSTCFMTTIKADNYKHSNTTNISFFYT